MKPSATDSRRFLRQLIKRLENPIVPFLLDKRIPLNRQFRQYAVERFILGLPVAQIAKAHKVKPAEVRMALAAVRGWFRGFTAAAKRADRRGR